MELEFNIPTTWNKLNIYQCSEILNIIINNKVITPILEEKILSILFVDENPDNETYSSNFKCEKYAKLLRQTTPVEIIKQYKPLDFIFNSMSLTNFPPTIEINHKGKEYIFYGPNNRLSNITIEEFSFCDHLFYDWKTKKNNQFLDILITALYRPLGINNQRENFKRHSLSLRSTILPTLNEKLKLVIGHAYQGSRDVLINKFPIVFPKQKFKNKPKVVKYKSFNSMINTMAVGENKPLGVLKDVEQTNVFKFFEIVQECILMNREKQQQLKK